MNAEAPVKAMGKIIKALKNKNRTLLEMHIGMFFFGICCQAAGAFIVKEQLRYAASLWFGIAFALAASVHMYRTLERAMSAGADASKLMTRGYLFRYGMIAFVLVLASLTGALNPLIVFLGYMSLKVTAYIQPFTHKLCNMLFHETDPVPEALPEEDVPQEEEIFSGQIAKNTRKRR